MQNDASGQTQREGQRPGPEVPEQGKKSFIQQFNDGEHDSRWAGIIPMKDPAEYKEVLRSFNKKREC
jgi:hypothetical protein